MWAVYETYISQYLIRELVISPHEAGQLAFGNQRKNVDTAVVYCELFRICR